MIKVNLISGGTIYLNPYYIERVYATAPLPNNSVIVLTTGVPDVAVQENNAAVLSAIRSDTRAGS